jgi:TonB family protein
MLGVPVIQKGNVRYLLGLDAGEYRGLLEGSPLSIRSGPVKAEFPPMSLSAVEAQLQNCTSLMLERWGMSREDQSKLASFPKLKPKPIERAKAALSGYPDSAAQRGAMGSVRMLVNVDAAGQISGCRVMRSSGHADLDSDACTALRTRMQFDPAVDRQGRKVASLFVADFRYIVLVF